MRDQLDFILKWLGIGLAVLLVYELGSAVLHFSPLHGVKIPDLPSLPADAQASGKATNAAPAQMAGGKGSNAAPAHAMGTNAILASGTNVSAGTNVSGDMMTVKKEKPSASPEAGDKAAVQLTEKSGTNAMTMMGHAAAVNDTNAMAKATTVAMGTNAMGTNAMAAGVGSNGTARVRKASASPGGGSPEMMMASMGGRGGNPKLPELPAPIKARVNRIVESELFGPVPRPQPMALLGIAGNSAILRSPMGQTGMAKEGESVGELKVVRIGINRVLVEQNGEKKELTIFNGYGSESLLPKQPGTPDETTKK